MHIHIFESPQPEGLLVGDIVYKIHSNQEYVLLAIKGNFLNIIKSTSENPISNVILSSERLKAFPIRSAVR